MVSYRAVTIHQKPRFQNSLVMGYKGQEKVKVRTEKLLENWLFIRRHTSSNVELFFYLLLFFIFIFRGVKNTI